MKPLIALVSASFLLVTSGQAAVLVNDSWSDGLRIDPGSPTYSENGVDADLDGNFESAWFMTGGTTTVSIGHLINQPPAGSTSWTTYFTPEANPVTLANPGDQLKITWIFMATGINSASTSQGFRVAVVDSPSASRLAADGAPGTPAVGSAYTGYALFSNMRTGNLGNGNSFQLSKRADNTNSPNAFLSASAAWTATSFANTGGANTSTPGYTEGAQDTLVLTITRNGSSGLDVVATMTGTGLGTTNQGFLTVSATDASPTSFTFDTFGSRPQTVADTATQIDMTGFKVEVGSVAIPEPSIPVLLLAGAGLAAVALRRRRRA